MANNPMNESQLVFLREQLQETLCCWRDANDLPEHVDEELCDLVLACSLRQVSVTVWKLSLMSRQGGSDPL